MPSCLYFTYYCPAFKDHCSSLTNQSSSLSQRRGSSSFRRFVKSKHWIWFYTLGILSMAVSHCQFDPSWITGKKSRKRNGSNLKSPDFDTANRLPNISYQWYKAYGFISGIPWACPEDSVEFSIALWNPLSVYLDIQTENWTEIQNHALKAEKTDFRNQSIDGLGSVATKYQQSWVSVNDLFVWGSFRLFCWFQAIRNSGNCIWIHVWCESPSVSFWFNFDISNSTGIANCI